MLTAGNPRQHVARLAGLLIWLLSMYFFSTAVQNDWLSIMMPAVISFSVYLAVLQHDREYLIFWLAAAFLARVLFVFSFPGLSDDIYRFYFDGKILLSGQSPYGMLPSAVQESAGALIPDVVYEKMNSRDYYTVYPPLAQIIYGLPALTGDIGLYKILLSLLLLIIEAAGIFFMLKICPSLELKSSSVLVYALNPLVIAEGIGNLHAEILVVSFLAIFLYFFTKKNLVLSGLFFALATATKLLPLLLLPWLYFRLNDPDKKRFFLSAGFVLFLLFIPFMIQPGLFSVFNSLDLYFRKFEFNGSIYVLLREIGNWVSGYNLVQYIGPFMGLTTFWFIVKVARTFGANEAKSWLQPAFISWFFYLLLSTTVHPWYVIPLVFFSVFAYQKAALIWSFLVLLSYVHYDPAWNKWQPFLLFIEYVILFYFIWKDGLWLKAKRVFTWRM